MYYHEYVEAVKKEWSDRGLLASPLEDWQIHECYNNQADTDECIYVGLDVWAGHDYEDLMQEYIRKG